MEAVKPELIDVKGLKAEAYDIFVELQERETQINNFIKENVTPMRDRLAQINIKLNEARSSDTQVQGQDGTNGTVAQ